MNKLIYKEYTWPQNPDHYEQVYVREPVYTKNEVGETVFSGMGPQKLTITGSGSFFGDAAYEKFRMLVDVFKEPSPGTLIHLVWGQIRCYFTKLQLTEEPRPNYVAYKFEFREADEDGAIPQ